MTYREVTMLETKELLRLWMNGMGIKTNRRFPGRGPEDRASLRKGRPGARARSRPGPGPH